MNKNMKDLIVDESISSYLYIFHTHFKQIMSMFRQNKPIKKNTTIIAKSWPKKFVMDIISFPL